MKRKIFIFVFLFLSVSAFLFWRSYIRVFPEVLLAYETKDRGKLLQILQDQDYNWYQRSYSAQFFAKLSCREKEPILIQILEKGRTEFRRAVLEGCYESFLEESSEEEKNLSEIVKYGLRDGYSYNRFQTLEFLENKGIFKGYCPEIEKLCTNSSSMVGNKAKDLFSRCSFEKTGAGDQKKKNP